MVGDRWPRARRAGGAAADAGGYVERLGIRTLSAGHRCYNPHSYHRGSIWPHDNGIIAAGFRRYGFAREAGQLARGIWEATAYFDGYRLPELYASMPRAGSSFPVQYLGANIPQAWAAGTILHLIRTLLGWKTRSRCWMRRTTKRLNPNRMSHVAWRMAQDEATCDL